MAEVFFSIASGEMKKKNEDTQLIRIYFLEQSIRKEQQEQRTIFAKGMTHLDYWQEEILKTYRHPAANLRQLYVVTGHSHHPIWLLFQLVLDTTQN
ncbi:hypothetical protein SK128_018038 [Halocaridina rubra]|uniref:Uncharacterized protein n=1 Tax=Halocaridina rubra TaxID=373956 RepID=A0AAN8XEV4_HALRR